MAAYFNDMGSVTFDVLSSPTSVPVGRVQVSAIIQYFSNFLYSLLFRMIHQLICD